MTEYIRTKETQIWQDQLLELYSGSQPGVNPMDRLGVVVDGCPAGIPLTTDYIQAFLDRRKPGQSKFTTARRESDTVEILSGVFEGYTTGTPISLVVRNNDQRSHDYSNIKDCYRPGHADYTFDKNTDYVTIAAADVLRKRNYWTRFRRSCRFPHS